MWRSLLKLQFGTFWKPAIQNWNKSIEVISKHKVHSMWCAGFDLLWLVTKKEPCTNRPHRFLGIRLFWYSPFCVFNTFNTVLLPGHRMMTRFLSFHVSYWPWRYPETLYVTGEMVAACRTCHRDNSLTYWDKRGLGDFMHQNKKVKVREKAGAPLSHMHRSCGSADVHSSAGRLQDCRLIVMLEN